MKIGATQSLISWLQEHQLDRRQISQANHRAKKEWRGLAAEASFWPLHMSAELAELAGDEILWLGSCYDKRLVRHYHLAWCSRVSTAS